MKNFIVTSVFCLLFSQLFAQNLFLKNWCAGAEVYHDWVSDSTYKITVRKITHCTSATFTNGLHGWVFDTSDVSVLGTMDNYAGLLQPTLPDGRTAFSRTLNACLNFPSQCDTPVNYAKMYGYKEVYFESYNFTLPHKSGKFRHQQSVGSDPNANLRDSSNTNIKRGGPNPGTGFYYHLEAGINASDWTIRNHSARMDNPGPYYASIGKAQIINYVATDPDGDSLVYHIIHSKTPNYSFFPYPMDDIPFLPAFSLAEPFATNGTYKWDSISGQMSFTAAYRQNAMITLLIDEYRQGVWVGSNMHDMPIEIINSASEPNLTIAKTSQNNVQYLLGDTMVVCPNKPLSLCYNLSSTSSNANLEFKTNIGSRIPNANMSLNNNYSSNVSACINWTPSIADAGLHTIYLQIRDTNCSGTTLNLPTSQLVHIKVLDKFQSLCWPANVINMETSKIAIFPNPTKDFVFVESSVAISNYELYNAVGNIICKGINPQQSGISVANLASGIYFLKVKTENGSRKMLRFVKE